MQKSDALSFLNAHDRKKSFQTLSGIIVFSYCTASAVVSAVLETATFIVYYRLSRTIQLTYREDYKLLRMWIL